MTELAVKQCTKCLKILSVTNFYKSSAYKDGYQGHCKACRREYESNNRATINAGRRIKYAQKQGGLKPRPLPSNSLEVGEAAFRAIVRKYKKNAIDRGYLFDLTDDEIRSVVSQPCIYCGLPPNNTVTGLRGGEYRYSGMDRVDNSVGYILSNVVPCCKQCNFSKRNQTEAEWLDYINRLVAFHQHQ